MNGQWYNVEYEGLHVICTQYGCYGHLLKDCPVKPKAKVAVVAQEGGGVEAGSSKGTATQNHQEASNSGFSSIINDNDKGEILGDALHGDWLVVKRKKRGSKANNTAVKSKGSQFQNLPLNFDNHFGNKFESLLQDMDQEKALKSASSLTHTVQLKGS